MSPPGGSSALASQAASPANTSPLERDRDHILVAAYRLRALGWTESAALLFIEDMSRISKDRAGRRIRRMSDAQLRRRLFGYERDRRKFANAQRRGDLIQIRASHRWPWRVST